MAAPSHPLHRGPPRRQDPPWPAGLSDGVRPQRPPNFWKTLPHPEDRDRVLAEDQRCDQTLEPWRCTYRAIARDGRTIWVRDEAEMVYDDNGEPSYWQGVYLDITDHTMAQRETARRLAALEEQKNTLLTAVSHELSR